MHMAKELVSTSHKLMKEEEGRHIVAVEAFTLAKQRIKDLNAKLTKANKEKKKGGGTMYSCHGGLYSSRAEDQGPQCQVD